MAWAAFLKCRSKGRKKAVTSSKVRLPSYVRRLDDLIETPLRPDGPGVGSAEARVPKQPQVSSEEPLILNGLGGTTGVGCTSLVVSH